MLIVLGIVAIILAGIMGNYAGGVRITTSPWVSAVNLGLMIVGMLGCLVVAYRCFGGEW